MSINSYDEVPYPSFAYTQTHPGHLATLALLSGITPPPVETARVLELGCGEGGNLLPLASTLPHSRCLGVDLSRRAVKVAQSHARTLQLTNVDFEHADLARLDPGIGVFDYVVAYGVYSWVPGPVRDRLLQVIAHHLHPDGVAYVSYNALPGWTQFQVVRDAMLFHGRMAQTPEERLARGYEMLDRLAQSIPDRESNYRQIIRKVREMLEPLSDGYVLHDFLEEVNHPVYFREFVAHATRHGLQYLANAEQAGPEQLEEETTDDLGELAADAVAYEQYRDFITNRSFRETALAHAGRAVERTLDPRRLWSLCVGSRVEPSEPLVLDSFDRQTLVTPSGAALSTAHPLTKAALTVLARAAPRVLPMENLVRSAREELAAVRGAEARTVASRADELTLAENLLLAYAQNVDLVQLHAWAPSLVTEVGDTPEVMPTARLQATEDLPVTNRLHQRVAMDHLARRLVGLVDGSRDRLALARESELGQDDVEEQLARMASVGLLVG